MHALTIIFTKLIFCVLLNWYWKSNNFILFAAASVVYCIHFSFHSYNTNIRVTYKLPGIHVCIINKKIKEKKIAFGLFTKKKKKNHRYFNIISLNGEHLVYFCHFVKVFKWYWKYIVAIIKLCKDAALNWQQCTPHWLFRNSKKSALLHCKPFDVCKRIWLLLWAYWRSYGKIYNIPHHILP